MRKKIKLVCVSFLCSLLSVFASCGVKDYVLTEKTFFLVMTNMLYYPEQYLGSTIEYDCFTYELTDVNGEKTLCGVRKCSAGYGCTCGNDTIIGFILSCDGELPAPRNQSEDSNDKAWIHLRGNLASSEKTTITIYAYFEDGTIDYDSTEEISFLVFQVESFYEIEDYSSLNYYVTK